MKASLDCEIIKLLKDVHQSLPEYWSKYSPISNSQGVEEDIRRVNMFLNVQIGLLNFDSYELRSYLDNHSGFNEWLHNFKKHVAPILVVYGLPIWKME